MKGKRRISVSYFIITALLLFSVFSCNKETNQLPVCRIISPTANQIIVRGDTIVISVKASDIDGSIVNVQFFIDGVEKSSDIDFPFEYSWKTENEKLGKHLVKTQCFDNNGESSSDEVTINLDGDNISPFTAFSASVTFGNIPLIVAFTDQSSGSPTKWQWDFGDGIHDTIQNPTHTYLNRGFYSVSLKSQNAFGSDTDTRINYIVTGVASTATYTDQRDGQSYRTTTIADQTWFAENLNYEIGNSWCYGNNNSRCGSFGRLYDWETANIACPDGWHLPSDEEWKILEGNVDTRFWIGSNEWETTGYRGSDIGHRLKSTFGWNANGNGADVFKFEALPAGRRSFYGAYYRLEEHASFWTSTKQSEGSAIYRGMTRLLDKISRNSDEKDFGFSVRCLKD